MNASLKRSSPVRRLLVWLALLLAAFAVWHFFIASPPTEGEATQGNARRGGRHATTPAPVQAATASTRSVPHYLTGLGTVTAANTVTLKSRVEGELVALHFQEGQQVQAGDLLAEIDPRPFQVALTQAQGQLAKDQATLANARQNLARYQQLGNRNLISQQELDAQQSLVRETEGSLKADQGAVASAQLQLTYSKITAPMAGRVGLRQVDVGNYITAGSDTGIVVLTQTHPIDVVFTLPEDNIATLLRAQRGGQPVPVEAWDRTNRVKLAEGALLSLDNQIDATTGTIKIKARFSNLDDALFPNQFVNARVKVDTQQDAVVVPAAAVQMGDNNHFVWVLEADNRVSKRLVTPGVEAGQQVVIASGLTAGTRVVTDGLDRLKEGAQVEVVTGDTPANAPATHAQPRAARAGAH
ncbi:MdtA/MuxA family multidrug efflux RND transporter periplasmic adaptor subunit [Nissabacter sp. SGAir0207]|uniref:MdtA/MuxA family multidrug efflux RND transporter periplasmic adaptor subunit n=1 Tax=Nissabacter sp. SGAir0207 TaxID=2126321 RepID=UPI0010CD2A2D|nr:MdtA/MuxA family multidrug efflux RND transporter periplasmic adaptor subunit [Nissabacter sp. SGAir0207]QCR35323.1 multidrug transporter subunit MdtA [Nissabacter sp. SGAir0207]